MTRRPPTPEQKAKRKKKIERISAILQTQQFPMQLLDLSILIDREFGDTHDSLLLTAITDSGLKRVTRGKYTWIVRSDYDLC